MPRNNVEIVVLFAAHAKANLEVGFIFKCKENEVEVNQVKWGPPTLRGQCFGCVETTIGGCVVQAVSEWRTGEQPVCGMYR